MKFNESYFGELGTSPQVVSKVKDVTEQIAAAARASADVDTGAYRDGIEARMTRSRYRVVGRVVSTDPGSMAIEARTGNLRRALRRVTGA